MMNRLPAGRCLLAASAVAFLVCLAGTPAAAADLERCIAVDIEEAGWQRVESLRSSPGVELWVELGREMLLCGGDDDLEALPAGAAPLRDAAWIDRDRLFLAVGFRVEELDRLGVRLLARSSGIAVVEVQAGMDPSDGIDARGHRRRLNPLRSSSVVVRRSTNRPPTKRQTVFDPAIADLVADVNADSWFDDVVTLASWNRYTHGDQIDLARDWIAAELDAMPGLEVTTPSFVVPPWNSTVSNVIAFGEGTTRPDDWVIVGAHYDSTSEDPFVAAPGAEDNASGCAGVLEVARILTATPSEATVLYICYAGEEQGLYGSQHHSIDLVSAGDDSKVIAMVNMDMIGYNEAASVLDVLLDTEPVGDVLVAVLDDAAAEFTGLVTEISSSWSCCSDHGPYLARGMPAALTIENDFGTYPDYHSTSDVPANLSLDMAREILRMNVAAVAQVAGAGTGSVFADGFETGDTSRWSVVMAAGVPPW